MMISIIMNNYTSCLSANATTHRLLGAGAKPFICTYIRAGPGRNNRLLPPALAAIIDKGASQGPVRTRDGIHGHGPSPRARAAATRDADTAAARFLPSCAASHLGILHEKWASALECGGGGNSTMADTAAACLSSWSCAASQRGGPAGRGGTGTRLTPSVAKATNRCYNKSLRSQ